jgi:lipopolysaccharide biosynthesis regulator YciM
MAAKTQSQLEGEMTFPSQMAARQFLIDKITAQAERAAAPLSEGEARMLELNLDIPKTAIGIPVEILEDKNHAFESKIVRLLKAAYNQDGDNAQELERYKEALRALRNSDHYMLIVATGAIPVRRNWSWVLVYLLIALAMAAMIVGLEVWTRGK